ncbi:MAG TPA: citrate/2-methylcitrate synthase [Acidimicrobiales bacterium]|jgi:citrate synthase|nr:citrate/2-methylcitrate synthase [Acidimicrobiales bacterium]
MINRRVSSAEAAERLGVKPATLYAYVSRGLLHPERTSKGSTFALHEVVQLARSGRNPGRPGRTGPRRTATERAAGDPVFVTELTYIDGDRLYYRGLDAVELSRTRPFEEVATWLWTGEWDGTSEAWLVADPVGEAVGAAMAAIGASRAGVEPVERYMAAVVAASVVDELRHDLNPAGVPVTARGILTVLAQALPLADPIHAEVPVRERVWRGLGAEPPSEAGLAAVDAALVLAADHELAPSTLAARLAASFRADPYAVVLTGLGPASGSWQPGSTGAPGEVESLLHEASRVGPERAIGSRLKRGEEVPHGFGMPLYPEGDPRGRELLARLGEVGPADRRDTVSRLIEVAAERGFPPPNFDLGLGALSYCAGMVPGSGQAMFTLAKAAGWLAHAIEEYIAPTRFRTRADYVGPLPDADSEAMGSGS